MQLLIQLGQLTGARRMIPIESAHIDGCLYHGQVSLDFAERLLGWGGKVAVPTTLNVSSLDRMTPSNVKLEKLDWEAAKRLMDAYETLGCKPTWTCAPYQLDARPRFGQHIGWAESNAIVFANSVLGARTNRYGDFIDICAAIAGCVPETGLHLSENRFASWLFRISVEKERWLVPELLYPLTGYLIGSQCGFAIPAIDGLPTGATEDDLKALGATAASSGSVAMFHAIGVTPEASSIDEAFSGRAPKQVVVLDDAAFQDAYTRLNTLREGDTITAVSLGTPHFSLSEFEKLLPLLHGKRRHASVEFFVSTSRSLIQQLKQTESARTLVNFGATVVVDTCTYITPILRQGRNEGAVMTNSGKWAHYAPANLGVHVALGSLQECVESAIQGKVCRC